MTEQSPAANTVTETVREGGTHVIGTNLPQHPPSQDQNQTANQEPKRRGAK